MKSLDVNFGNRSYQVIIGSGVMPLLGSRLARLGCGQKLLLVTNTTVGPLYGGMVRDILTAAGYRVLYCEIADGEEYKSLPSADLLYTAALDGELQRGDAVLALGGGVIGDLAGFVAATYMRGTPLVQLPTTLLAQVDSSVGGKVAVNHPLGKNMIGSFHQPRLVLADINTLPTLPQRELRSGLAEVIKYGVLRADCFDFLEQHLEQVLQLDQEILSEVIALSCQIKARIVEQDETEGGRRAILNFGHTVGHILETLTGYRRYRHGEAVAAGMAVAATLAVNLGLFERSECGRLLALLQRAGLPTAVPFPPEKIIPLLAKDKKARGGRPRFILPLSLGKVDIFADVPTEAVAAAIAQCREKGSELDAARQF